MCKTETDLDFAAKAIKYYENKGNDFKSDISGLFVQICLACNNYKVATDILLVPKYRINAWLPFKSHIQLLEVMQKSNDFEKMIALEELLIKKGGTVNEKSLRILVQAASESGIIDIYTQAVNCAKRVLQSDAVEKIVAEFPQPPANSTSEVETEIAK